MILYNTTNPEPSGTCSVTVAMARDRVQVFVDGVRQVTVYRGDSPTTVTVPAGPTPVAILVENMGRLNYGRWVLVIRLRGVCVEGVGVCVEGFGVWKGVCVWRGCVGMGVCVWRGVCVSISALTMIASWPPLRLLACLLGSSSTRRAS